MIPFSGVEGGISDDSTIVTVDYMSDLAKNRLFSARKRSRPGTILALMASKMSSHHCCWKR
ncbi:hypothetical protein OUZ56_028770 [Daphnia magna]|uniref:Uncharacterized protein n=1 Tax=Daphnia magna TaxID=35525 RepID=A0ABR0B4V5_9CRUS|nr:hypothetical protein OUZ56_028770 [Daphnia magna]